MLPTPQEFDLIRLCNLNVFQFNHENTQEITDAKKIEFYTIQGDNYLI